MTANIEKRQRGIAGLQMKEHKNNPRQPKKKKREVYQVSISK